MAETTGHDAEIGGHDGPKYPSRGSFSALDELRAAQPAGPSRIGGLPLAAELEGDLHVSAARRARTACMFTALFAMRPVSDPGGTRCRVAPSLDDFAYFAPWAAELRRTRTQSFVHGATPPCLHKGPRHCA